MTEGVLAANQTLSFARRRSVTTSISRHSLGGFMNLLRAVGRHSIALVAAFLAACGGGGGEPAPAVIVSAVPDDATLDWNTSATVDVLANDVASRGGLTLVTVGAAGHGQAAVSQGRVRYTPNAGFYGTDTVDYTVRSDDGSATVTGTLRLTVQARLQLQGIVSDDPVAGAQLSAAVGSASTTAVAGPDGAYSVVLRSSDPGAFVTLEAVGVSSQSAIRLRSQLGDWSSLVSKADASGLVRSSQVPSLNVTHLTTAAAVLAERVAGGAVTSVDALARATAGIASEDLIRHAAPIRLVAAGGAPLPAGVSDTLALLRDKTAFDTFVKAYAVDALDKTPWLEAEASVTSRLPSTSGPALAVGADQTVAYFSSDDVTLLVQYRPGGTATVWAYDLASRATKLRTEATWTQSTEAVSLVLAMPMTQEVYEYDPMGFPTRGELRVEELRLKQHLGDAHGGAASLSLIGSAVFVEGDFVGQPIDVLTTANFGPRPYRLMTSVDIGRRMPIAASEIATGSRLAGVLTSAALQGTPFAADGSLDILRFAGTGVGLLEETGSAVSWTLADDWLTVVHGAQQVRYARLSRDASTGEEHWVAILRDGGVDTAAHHLRMVVADPSPAFTAETVQRAWFLSLAYRVAEPRYLHITVYADGTVHRIGPTLGTWALDSNGRIDMLTPIFGTSVQTRRWIPVKRVGDHQWVLQRVAVDGVAAMILTMVTDKGAAVK